MQEPRKRSYTLHSGKSNVFLSKQEGIFKINIFFLHNFFYNYFKNFYFFYLYLINSLFSAFAITVEPVPRSFIHSQRYYHKKLL